MHPTIAQSILQDRRIGCAITDRDLKVLEVSGATSILHEGCQSASCLGCWLLDLVPELTGSELKLADMLAGELPRLELPLVNRKTAEGQTIYLMMVLLPCQDRSRRIVGLVYLVQDVTEIGTLQQRLAQQRNELRILRDELAAANTELRRLDGMKSTFVSIAAHELNSPLTSIRGFVEVLLDEEADPLTDKQRAYLRIVQRAAHHLMNITCNLLDVARIEVGRVALSLQPTELPALVENLVVEFAPQLQAKAQRLTVHVSPDLPPALCDETRAAQIVGNLLSNANKYTLQGGLITINLALADEEGFLQLSVADNGVGISAEDQAKLFRRFFRAESAKLAETDGVGLGLYITRSLVELHGGRIWFETELGEGSTFHVTFPIGKAFVDPNIDF